MSDGTKMNEQDQTILESALGKMMLGAMADILALPEEHQLSATYTSEIKTVDGHAWTITLEYGGFEGPGSLKREGGNNG